MEIIQITKNIKKLNLGFLDITIGAYDGIHDGHIAVINELVNNKISKKTAVMTFDSHPDIYLQKRTDDGVIETNEEKASFFEKLGVDYLLVLDNEYLDYTYQEFNDFLLKIGVIRVVVGVDFVYGKGALGNFHTLRRNFIVKTIDLVNNENGKLSSSIVRSALQDGNIDLVNQILKEDFTITGVAKNEKIIGEGGSLKSFYLEIGNKYHDLRCGAYKINIFINGETYLGIGNFGYNPTEDHTNYPKFEVHIFDYEGTVLDKEITIKFIKFMRDEVSFSPEEELNEQISLDIKKAGDD